MNEDERQVIEGATLQIAVVGHTNTGKTSLLRTLTRDRRFGEVSFRPGTTRHVEVARLLIQGKAVLALYDTPGMEEPIALLELLEDLSGEPRLDGPARVRAFLELEVARARFEQEAKVLRQMLHSDAAFYVIDARDPVLAKHRDELAVLNSCGIPLLPLLNFVAGSPAGERAWREALARVGLHAVVSFDTVAPVAGSERLLYEKLATLLDAHRGRLQALIRSHEHDARQRHQAALQLIAELLVDVASCRLDVPARRLGKGLQQLNNLVTIAEQRVVRTLLDLYSFDDEDLQRTGLPLSHGGWQREVFDVETLQVMGLRLGGGAAAGAATGLGIDLAVGGLSLGLATALGALAGGGLQSARHYGRDTLGRFTGSRLLRVEDDIVRLLAARQLHLLRSIEGRGHAAVGPLQPDGKGRETLWSGHLPAPLRRARNHPQWSALRERYTPSAERQLRLEALVVELGRLL